MNKRFNWQIWAMTDGGTICKSGDALQQLQPIKILFVGPPNLAWAKILMRLRLLPIMHLFDCLKELNTTHPEPVAFKRIYETRGASSDQSTRRKVIFFLGWRQTEQIYSGPEVYILKYNPETGTKEIIRNAGEVN